MRYRTYYRYIKPSESFLSNSISQYQCASIALCSYQQSNPANIMAEQMIPVTSSICVVQIPAVSVSRLSTKSRLTVLAQYLPESSALAVPNFGADVTQPPVAHITTYPFQQHCLTCHALRENTPKLVSSHYFPMHGHLAKFQSIHFKFNNMSN